MSVKHHILVVEDDLAIRDLLRDRLRQYDLTFATCQSEAHEKLRSPNFHLVLLDLRLPRRPGDMELDHEVGLGIVDTIRSHTLRQHGTAMMMPIVVMTAYGSEKISTQALSEKGANYYIRKPFEDDLEEKLERAIAGEWALVPAASVFGGLIRLAFHPNPSKRIAHLETLAYKNKSQYELLRVLGDLFIQDMRELRSPDMFRRITGGEFSAQLKIPPEALRKRIERFRGDTTRDFRMKVGKAIGRHDIIENRRDWDGYRLNPQVVRVVRWEDLVPGSGEG